MFHVIDDIKELVEILKNIISDVGYEVLCFASGEHYLEYLNSPEFQKPVAVLSDVEMPGMTGYQLALEIRKKYDAQKIVFLTGKADNTHYKFAISKECFTLEKPYHPEELIALINFLAACEEDRETGKNCERIQQCKFGIDYGCPFVPPKS